MRRRRSWGTRCLLRVLPPLVRLVVRTLGVTWRVRISGLHHYRAALAAGPVVITSFHGRLFAALHVFSRPRYRPWRILISASTDGEFIARVAGGLGFETARGSSNRRGDAGYRELVRSIRGRPQVPVGFLVDGGGRGPRGTVKPGAVRLASATRGSLLPILTVSRPCWIAHRSWDRFQVPWPFATVHIAILPPMRVPAGGEARRAAARARLEAVMVAAQERLDRRVGLPDRTPVREPTTVTPSDTAVP